MWSYNFKKAVVGQQLSVRSINPPQEAIEDLANITATAPIGLDNTTGVPKIYWAGPAIDIRIAFTAGGMSGAVDSAGGRAPGTGQADLYILDPTTGSMASTDQNVPVNNLSVTPIPPSQWIKVFQDSSGNWWIFWLDCGP